MKRLFAIICLMLAGTTHASERVADEHIILHTFAGDIVMHLYIDAAPEHVKQLVKLARMGVYDGTHFHRVDPTFLIQLANAEDRRFALTPEQQAAIHPLKAEYSKILHRRGTLTMARPDDNPDGAATSFSILVVNAPHLDGKYTVFGYVDEQGLEVVSNILKIERSGTSPLKRAEVYKASVVTTQELASIQLRTAPPPKVLEFGVPKNSAALIGLLLVLSLCAFLLASREKLRGVLYLTIAHLVLTVGALAATLLPAFGNDDDETGTYWQVFPATQVVCIGLGIMLIIGLVSLVSRRRFGHKTAFSINMLNILLATFLLFMLLTPIAYQQRLLALGVLIGVLTMFKLMSGFENA
jgi:cyclophilin family peptidyl-prolyl cis-trans isomerase